MPMGLLTVTEVATRLRLHEMTVRRQIRAGRLRAVRVGRGIRVREEDLEAFVTPERQRHEITPEELRTRIMIPPSLEEIERRRKIGDAMKRLRNSSKPLGISTATLIRIARRSDELAYGEKTWDELVAEES